ncbi:hypothetical protein PRIPAC_97267 [Pristionchus pacificus]|uniref:Alpha_adaptinC2 domain-containing protein n=1 Tax=Pristionchus pacificus TaxID=54126 RepID=A0A454Y1F7_PRIPA|nr:hypothetical protein PRIPAC_97267 [Pristionchus pacificus]|eukprot:PDM63353.1 hypothetical protein PRIPAC_53710 [Pristionchus pacificus]
MSAPHGNGPSGLDIETANKVIDLLRSTSEGEKELGYGYLDGDTLLNSDFKDVIVGAIKHDLISVEPAHIKLGLKWVANCASLRLAEEFVPELGELLNSGCIRPSDEHTLLHAFLSVPQFIEGTEYARSLLYLLNGKSIDGLVTPPLIYTVFQSDVLLRAIMENVIIQLMNTLSHDDINLRMRAAESLSLLAKSDIAGETVKKHLDTVIVALKKEKEASVVRPIVNCIYALCDRRNTSNVIVELLQYLETADNLIKEELASRVATIATVHPIDYAWFTDSILSILRIVRTAGIDAYERVLPGLMYELHSYLKDIEPATRDVWMEKVAAELPVIAAKGANGDTTLSFVTRDEGILYEDNHIHIRFKVETCSHLGRIYVTYRNKTGELRRPEKFTNLDPYILTGGSLGVQLQVQSDAVNTVVDAGAEVQQLINIVCVQEFSEQPMMRLQFIRNGPYIPSTFDKCLYLPIFIWTFFQPTKLDSDEYYHRWFTLGRTVQQGQKGFHAKYSMDKDSVISKLGGLCGELIDDVGPYPPLLPWSGMIDTQSGPIPVLIRLMPNSDTKTFLLTIRCAKDTVSKQLVEHISSLL